MKRSTPAEGPDNYKTSEPEIGESTETKELNVGSDGDDGVLKEQIRKPPKIRLVHESDRLSPRERKSRFARNLDQLLTIIGVGRKEAAAEIGITYSLIRRLVTAGVSRIDDLNRESLRSIANYFGLTDLYDFWWGTSRLTF